MERINRILTNKNYQKYIEKNIAAEENRVFCRHNMEHFLDVARIGWIINLEEQLGQDKEMIYAAALLHDIGRHMQYESRIPHEEASVQLAGEILVNCGFEEEEIRIILDAIGKHRGKSGKTMSEECTNRERLADILYRADKASRACFTCPVCEACNWSQEKKNLTLVV